MTLTLTNLEYIWHLVDPRRFDDSNSIIGTGSLICMKSIILLFL
jgi:hypothetical protein